MVKEAQFQVVWADAEWRRWDEHLATFRARWAEQGRWCAERPPRGRERVWVDVDPADFAHLPRRQRERWSELDVCAEALARYWDEELPGRDEPKQKRYGTFASGKPDYPPPSAFEQHGGFAAVRERARQLRRRS